MKGSSGTGQVFGRSISIPVRQVRELNHLLRTVQSESRILLHALSFGVNVVVKNVLYTRKQKKKKITEEATKKRPFRLDSRSFTRSPLSW